jgi:hypothetical protein
MQGVEELGHGRQGLLGRVGGNAIALRVKLFRSQVVKFTSWAALQNAI